METRSSRRRPAIIKTIPARPRTATPARNQLPKLMPRRVSVRSEIVSAGGATAGAGGLTAGTAGSVVAAVLEGGVDPVLPELSMAAAPAADAAAFSRDSSVGFGAASVDFL